MIAAKEFTPAVVERASSVAAGLPAPKFNAAEGVRLGYVMDACRPVLMEAPVKTASFEAVRRTFISGRAPSEIVLARKPAA